MIDEKSLMAAAAEDNLTADEDSDVRENDSVSNPTVFEKPEDIDDSLWDSENNIFKSQELYKAWKSEKEKATNLRKSISKVPSKPAETIQDFTIDNPQDLGIDPGDEKINVLKNVALESGLSNSQFQKMLNAFHKAGQDGHFTSDDEVDPEDYAQKEEARVASEMELLGKNGSQVVNNVKAWGKNLLKAGVLSQDDFNAYIQLGTTAHQIRVLDKLRQAAGYVDDIAVDAGSINGSKSIEEIQLMMADPRYETSASYRKKIEDLFAANVGER